jgi:acetyltransferase-like isoleucine patch superfamily enzyme
MIIQIIKKVHMFLFNKYLLFKNSSLQLKYFILPNLKLLIRKNIQYVERYPNCTQITIITGSGKVRFGKNCSFGFKSGGFHRGGSIEFQTRSNLANIIIGNNVSTNNNIFICAFNNIEIGDDTIIGQNVIIMDFEAHGIHPKERRKIGQIGTINIGKNVWIGNNVSILKNTVIGDNTIVATGAVVSGQFDKNQIIGGVPARIIRNCKINWKRNIKK